MRENKHIHKKHAHLHLAAATPIDFEEPHVLLVWHGLQIFCSDTLGTTSSSTQNNTAMPRPRAPKQTLVINNESSDGLSSSDEEPITTVTTKKPRINPPAATSLVTLSTLGLQAPVSNGPSAKQVMILLH